MQIYFEKIKLHNFMSFADIELQLNNQGYTLVSGINNNVLDNAHSNGVGKSACFEGIVWTLFGETIRGNKSVANQQFDDGCHAILWFKIGNDSYRVERYKDDPINKTNLKVYVNDVDKSGKGIRDTEKLLMEYLPDITSTLLGNVVILGQGLPQRFTNNTPSGRKEILEKLSKSDYMIEDLKDKLSKRKLELQSSIRQFEDSTLSTTSQIDVYKKQVDELGAKKESLLSVDYDTEIEKVQYDLKTITTQLTLLTNLKCEKELAINQMNTSKNNIKTNYDLQVYGIKEEYQDKKSKLDNKLATNNVVLVELKKKITEAKSIKDICPTCGQHLPHVHKIDTTDLERELSIHQELKEEIEKQIKDITNTFNSSKNEFYTSYQSAIQKLDADNQDNILWLRNNSNQIQLLSTNTAELTSKLNSLQMNKNNLVTNLDQITHQINDTTKIIGELTDKLLYYTMCKDNTQKHLDVINKMITLTTRDFRGHLLFEVINYINNKSKEYALEIFNHTQLDFTLNGNNIDITYCDKSYEALSGGEKQKVDIIIQFAIRDMLTKFLNFNSNILVLDEIFDNLDNIGCEKIINLITTKLIDIESIFIISHHSGELQLSYDNEITIVKGADGISGRA